MVCLFNANITNLWLKFVEKLDQKLFYLEGTYAFGEILALQDTIQILFVKYGVEKNSLEYFH
jgi:hypothetical protein